MLVYPTPSYESGTARWPTMALAWRMALPKSIRKLRSRFGITLTFFSIFTLAIRFSSIKVFREIDVVHKVDDDMRNERGSKDLQKLHSLPITHLLNAE